MRTELPPELMQSIQHDIRSFLRQQSDELWRAEEIAGYLKLGKKSVQNRILSLPTFPPPVFLPTGEKTKRWVSKEVRAWALKHR